MANEKLADADVMTILKWAKKKFGDGLAMTTAFGYSGLVLLHHALQIMPRINIYFIDTGYHFPETIEFCNRIAKEWNLNLEVLKPAISKKQLEKRIGKAPYKKNPDLCYHYCKVEPLLRVIHEKAAWLSGLRKDQSITRADIEVIELDGRGVIKVSPLANWTREQTWDYIRKHNIPTHPLHEKGYPSIGCEPCTSSVKEGGDERDGRWPFMQKVECGIHLRRKKKKS